MAVGSQIESVVQSIRHAREGFRNAKFYYLWRDAIRYPSTGGFSLFPFQEPLGVPPGTYRLGFLSGTGGDTPIFLGTHEPPPQLTIDGGTDAAPTDARALTPKKAETDPLLSDPEHHRDRVEAARMRMADDAVLNTHLVGKQITNSQEHAEAMLTARFWRQESQITTQRFSEIQRRQFDDVSEMQTVMIKSFLRQFATFEELSQKAMRGEANSGERSQFWGVLGQLLALLSDGKRSGVLDALVGTDMNDKKLEDARKLLAETKREIETRTAEKGEKAGESPAKETPPTEKKSDAPPEKNTGHQPSTAATKRTEPKSTAKTEATADVASILHQLTTEIAESRKNQAELSKVVAALAARVDGSVQQAPSEVAADPAPAKKRSPERKKARR